MRISISDRLRKLAGLIERDNTPEEVTIGEVHMLANPHGDGHQHTIKKNKIVSPVEEKLTPTAPSQQRRPREQPIHKNKWNEDTKTGLMQEYMQEYRADGKDKEVDGPNSTYKKKFKV